MTVGVDTVPADVGHDMQLPLRVVDVRLGTAAPPKSSWGLTANAGPRLAAPGTVRAGLDALLTAGRTGGTWLAFGPSGSWQSQQ